MNDDRIIWSLCTYDIVDVAKQKGIENPEEFVAEHWGEIQSAIEFGLEFWEEVVCAALDVTP